MGDGSNNLDSDHNHINLRTIRLDFPKFYGENVVEWVYKANQFFSLYQTPETQRIKIANLHFEGQPLVWYQNLEKSDLISSWDNLCDQMTKRFGENLNENPLDQLIKLKQRNSVKEYKSDFEIISNRVKDLSEEHKLTYFICGLKEEIGLTVKMLFPKSIETAFSIAKYQEEKLHLEKKPNFRTFQSQAPNNQATFSKTNNTTAITKLPPIKRLTQDELTDRRQKNLCYNCDEKWFRGHVCVKPKIFLLQNVEEFENEINEESVEEIDENIVGENAEITLQAITGVTNSTSIRFVGKLKGQKVSILVDSGSTHNFIDPKWVPLLKLSNVQSDIMEVKIANGDKIKSSGTCEKVKLLIQENQFEVDFLLLPLVGYDLVLGVHWLSQLGVINCDFKNLTMTFTHGNKKVCLKGLNNDTKIAEIQFLEGKMVKEQGFILQLYSTNVQNDSSLEDSKISPLLRGFPEVFSEPKGLPPEREHVHKIELIQGTNPISVRPYRYPYFQKNEIEKIVKELIESGFIRPSQSPFSSPVILVKKSDGSWRMCVDYRALNKVTIKDKFPIPVVDELLDELNGAKLFSKLDLRSGYHQIKMHANDVSKTAFRTHEGQYEFLVMPLVLTNAPATFQSAMNSVFKPFLENLCLFFFDDILVYSKTNDEHICHLEAVLKKMSEHKFFAKSSKCKFFQKEIDYLGHLISDQGVKADPNKIKAMLEWPVPKNLKGLRGFLGLTGYYRRFIRNYGGIARALTELLKKDAFLWSREAEIAFNNLKKAVTSPPVLALPDFNKTFTIECDASGQGVGAVLQQEKRPIAFFSKALKGRLLTLSTYEKELYALVQAIQKWRPYICCQEFIVNTDHQSLKYLLEQKISTPSQQKWLSKLLGYNFKIYYKQGALNKAADALSRVNEGQLMSVVVSTPIWEIKKEIMDCYEKDQKVAEISFQIANEVLAATNFKWINGLLFYKERLYVPNNNDLKIKTYAILHEDPDNGHTGFQKSLLLAYKEVYWQGLKKDLKKFVDSCVVCQTCKYGKTNAYGLLQPLPMPEQTWSEISMDFINGLPTSKNYNCIWVVVDRLTKYAHFIPLKHPFGAKELANEFLQNIFKLHGLPKKIISDRDTIFTSDFWKELFHLLGTKLLLSTAFHPQTDGQTEIVNKSLETYLRCYTSQYPKNWAKWIYLAEFWYNSTTHTSIKMPPFKALYGYEPPKLSHYLLSKEHKADIQELLQTKEEIMQALKTNYLEAQNRMKQNADLNRVDKCYKVGDYVYLKLQPYRQQSVIRRRNQKLAPRFFGPYKITEKVGAVAYKLELPPTSGIHPVFHISQLKLSIKDESRVLPQLPLSDLNGRLKPIPVKILQIRQKIEDLEFGRKY
uniref:RNA-directed DNA polymerase n=2 Tax=Primula vulgaris TaxID=175104 RepID=A5X2S4_9ERIC|nr:polyprotein [Primula vulgaris]